MQSTAMLQKHLPESVALTLTQRQLCDLELLLNQGFFPLTGFMNQADYHSVLDNMRLANGTLWPMPITLDITEQFAKTLTDEVSEIGLYDAEGLLLASLKIQDIWQIDKKREALAVFGTEDVSHPGVAYLFQAAGDFYVGGELILHQLPIHYDFSHLRHTPETLRQFFKEKNWDTVIGFQTRNPIHRAHQELTLRAAKATGGHLLIHPVVGMTKPGDIEYYTRVRCYEHVLKTYPNDLAKLSLLPLAMRMGGPREALWHALIRKNYGCTHFIVGRDHAGPGKDSKGNLFYSPYAAQELVMQHEKEIGINIIPFQEMAYSHKHKTYFLPNEFAEDDKPASVSGTELRHYLQTNQPIPEWFSYPEVIAELRKAYPSKLTQGLTLFLTGLPSSGKSTLANALAFYLREKTARPVTLLDGDVIRTHLSQGLGFSREDRDVNVTRVGFVAQEVTRHGGIAICALVAPFESARMQVKRMISEVGGFIEIHVATPLAVCETRDRKGLYKKARAGLVKQFTGISDPYEIPVKPDIAIDTSNLSQQQALQQIIIQIKALGYLP